MYIKLLLTFALFNSTLSACHENKETQEHHLNEKMKKKKTWKKENKNEKRKQNEKNEKKMKKRKKNLKKFKKKWEKNEKKICRIIFSLYDASVCDASVCDASVCNASEKLKRTIPSLHCCVGHTAWAPEGLQPRSRAPDIINIFLYICIYI